MDNENNFNFSNDNSFRKSSSKNYSSGGFGKSVFIPFLSGIVGATLVIGTCFGVPTIKSRLVGGGTVSKPITTSASTSDSSINLVNLSEYSNTSIAVAEKVLPSVVGITVTFPVNSVFGSSSTSNAGGSGIIISEDGYILTNNHVISSESSSYYYEIGKATSIKINLYNSEETFDATVVGTDTYTDLAVLKIDKTGLTPATLGNSDNVRVGEFVMAVGNPLGMDYSVTSGIVSAVNREVDSEGTVYYAIQTDAPINSGNSGGALVNSQGEVIGVNTLKLSGTGIEGIGFAIPISSTTSIVNQLIEYQTVKRPYIGIQGSSVDSTTAKRYNLPEGIYVESVEENSPASNAGLVQSDIITKIEGTDVKSVNELNKIKYTHNIGDTVTLTVYRNNEYIDLQIKLDEMPEQKEETQNNSNANSNPNNSQQIPGSIFDLFK